MRGILILSLLPISIATARAEDPALSAPIPRPAIATVTVPQPSSPSGPTSTTAQATTPQQAQPQSIAVPATANLSATATSGSPTADTAATGSGPNQSAPEAGRRKRLTMEEHFAQANVAHDGHLTLDEAKAGYRSLVRHFSEIDATHKGYVTIEDLRAWRAQQRAARNGTHRTVGALHPRPAYEPGTSTERRSFNTSAAQTIAKTPDASEGPIAVPAAQ